MSAPDRGELLRYLYHINYPATKQEICRQCAQLGAPEPYLTRLESIPNTIYIEPDTVLQALPHLTA
ncbi:DUF2795 domain-containing protein [Saccharopolyspora rectivirgula]|jgi:hypothetical protein|uniref:DUF2795 domain-containing protein n=1 Tax=Saccharopolyspora rectivirgula TaxID=28042 RepID=A0A073BB78_9PSEU|nr:DUF2795 domain-containing protein [Saccharopolyspora rectivirgula]KEI45029.1 hypothetical protein GU90_07445 [Saccharopolyspora rectivirgula]